MKSVRNLIHFVFHSKVTMDTGARRLIIELAGNSALTNLAEWFDHPPHVMKTNISEQCPVHDKLFDSQAEYSDIIRRHYRMSKGKSVVRLCLPSPVTKFLLCKVQGVNVLIFSQQHLLSVSLFSMPSVQLLVLY